MAGSFFSYVVQSYDLGVKRAFDYLSRRGSGNFLLLGNEIWGGQNLVFDLMESTFRMLIQQGCPDRRLHVENGLREIDAEFVRTNSITGVLSVQDSDAVRILGRLKEWGIAVPGQVSLVSYGNTELTKYFNPGITAVDCNYREMARTIADFITSGEKKGNRQVVISPEIRIRNT
jgi:LacI family transcriptional regulator